MTPPGHRTTAPPIPTAATALPRGLFGRLRKYAKILRVSLVERLTYRGDFLFGTLLRFLPMLTTILLWQAIYIGPGPVDALRPAITMRMIAYLLLVNISRMFSSMPGLAGGIARDIREGTLKKYLLQPLDMIWYLTAYRLAHKAAYIVASALPYAVLFFIFAPLLLQGRPRANFTRGPGWRTSARSSSALLRRLYFSRRASAWSASGSWRVSSLLYIVMTLNFFVSGHMLPLDLLPPFWSNLLSSAAVQLAWRTSRRLVFLGKVKGPGQPLVVRLLLEYVWAGPVVIPRPLALPGAACTVTGAPTGLIAT